MSSIGLRTIGVFVLVATIAVAAMAGVARRAAAAPDNTLGMAILSAAVSQAGTLVGGSGATGASKVPATTGMYEVTFSRNVLDCTYFPALANNTGGNVSGTISASSFATASTTVKVTTALDNGSAFDLSFHLMVFCHK
jgi:hypothetical protein